MMKIPRGKIGVPNVSMPSTKKAFGAGKQAMNPPLGPKPKSAKPKLAARMPKAKLKPSIRGMGGLGQDSCC